jgi:hypothetical protein
MAVPSADAMPLLDSHDLNLLRTNPCNVLVEGAAPATEAVLHLLASHLREPIVSHPADAPLALPRRGTRTLILRDVCALTRDAQRRLVAWLGDACAPPQIISTAARPLFPLVTEGLFDSVLYYRLNVMLLRVGTDATAVPISYGRARRSARQSSDFRASWPPAYAND